METEGRYQWADWGLKEQETPTIDSLSTIASLYREPEETIPDIPDLKSSKAREQV